MNTKKFKNTALKTEPMKAPVRSSGTPPVETRKPEPPKAPLPKTEPLKSAPIRTESPKAPVRSSEPPPVEVRKPELPRAPLPKTEPIRSAPIRTESPRPLPASPSGVSLEFVRPGAKNVYVAGSFNEWKPEKTPLTHAGGGRWVGNLSVKPGRHEYLFVVDGEWLPDPRAKETVQNPFGGKNSVLVVSE
jgi:hypothetical protein